MLHIDFTQYICKTGEPLTLCFDVRAIVELDRRFVLHRVRFCDLIVLASTFVRLVLRIQA